ncbi:hypothetical protein DHD32_22800, partial [Arenibacter sp. TNZ]|uniref:bZIP transcription factor n=1 Tax=Arenibacter catalasegens TaxID=2056779 RepID=UPI0037427C44|nr:hypothetical protein [Arenibacter sp. TNZ]
GTTFAFDGSSITPDWTTLINVPAGFADDTDDDTTYSAGAGLTLTGTVFAFDGSSITPDWTTFVNVPAGFADDTDDDTTYSAGAGLTLTGTTFAFDGSSITPDWTTLINVPAGFADDTDDDTTYSAGAGLILTGTVFAFDASSIPAGSIDGSQIVANFGAQNVTTTGSFISGTTTYPDYVFQKYFSGHSSLKESYDFTSLKEVEAFVKQNHHLPGIKSASEVESDGHWNLTQGAINNLEKIEELFLHTIEQEKKIDQLKNENESLSTELQSLRKDMDEIKALLQNKH